MYIRFLEFQDNNLLLNCFLYEGLYFLLFYMSLFLFIIICYAVSILSYRLLDYHLSFDNGIIQNSGFSGIIMSNILHVQKRTSVLSRNLGWIDSKFAERLRQIQKNDQYALVNDIIVTKRNSCSIYVILNNGNTKGYLRYNNDVSVILYIGNRTYKNRLKPFRKYHMRLLKYEVNDLPPKGHISLLDSSTSFRYNDLPYQMIPIPSKKKRIAICAYISSFNTIPEIKHWIAYYMIQHVDNLILYCAEPIDKFIKALHKSIESGFVILYHYPWPLTKVYKLSQRSIQNSQINSCFYRHRDFYEYIISQDVDEYFYSEKYPFDLYHAIQRLFVSHRNVFSLKVYVIYDNNK